MLKAKEDLEKYLEKEISKLVLNPDIFKDICDYSFENYNIPRAVTSDYVTLRNPLAEASEFILFCILDSIEKVTKSKKSVINDYFVEKEVKTYSASKFKVDKIKFPLRFKAIQIAEDHWMSSIDFKTLMKLRAAQLIVYDENTQRTMERVVRGNKEIYRIRIDQASVKKIEESYENGTYIPTPFTLNIPEDVEADFYYNEETCELVINKLQNFDIVDGYHRYIAACKACDSNSKLNLVMELRIINFPEYKAQQFIYQEDQKTRMPKIESNTFDQTNLANNIVDRISSKSESNLKGLITRNKTLINYADLADLIKYFYLNDKKANKNRNSILLSVTNELIENFNMLTEYAPERYLEKKYTYKQLVSVMYCFNYFRDKDKTNMCQVIDQVVDKVALLDNKKFQQKIAKKTMMNEIEEIMKEVL